MKLAPRCSLCVLMALAFVLSVQAADGAASRESVVTAVARSAAKARSISSAFFGAVPGTLATDPLQISTSIIEAMTVDYGDGTPQVTYQPGDTPAHSYMTAGVYQIKAVTGSTEIITMNINAVVPFNGSAASVYGIGVTPDSTDPKSIDILVDVDGTSATLDFGDGSASVPVTSGTQNSHVYGKGFFNAVVTATDGTNTRTGSVSFTAPLTSGSMSKSPELDVSGVTISPNPAKIGDTVTFSGTITAKNVSGDVGGSIDFGDGTTPFQASGSISGSLKTGVTHTYAANGVYTAILSLSGTGASASTKAYIIIGRGTVVNSTNGGFATEQDSTGGNVGLQLNVTNVTGATTATTTYDDTLPRVAPIDGLLPTRAFAVPTISVATSSLKDGSGTEKGKVRKTVAIGARAAGDSSGLADPASTEITLKKMSGKFIFAGTKPDQLSFSGTFQLPPGFDPAKTGGSSVAIGIGNIVDTLLIDEKGKPLDKSTGVNQRLKKLSVKYPKLAGATAAGGEVAQIDVTLSLANMVALGLDTEGITASLRSDEKKLKAANRFVQVDVLISGVAFESYIPVQYKVSSKGDAGQIAGRAGK